MSAGDELEFPQLIFVSAVIELDSRMLNGIAVIELDLPYQNWIRRV